MFAVATHTPYGGSIWTRPQRAARGPVPERSRDSIAAAAIAIADADGLAAVTMRSVASAIGTGPASLYRYVDTRAQLLELMADQARGELRYGRADGSPTDRLLALARDGRAVYRRHPWLLAIPADPVPGPNALAFLEHVLAVLADTGMSGAAKMETVGLFSGTVRLIAQTELDHERAGRDAARYQAELESYLGQVVTAGHHPRLAEALADAAPPRGTPPGTPPPPGPFDRAMTRIIIALLA